jgi:hypothetical protein
LRKENKHVSDELLDLKEKYCKNILQFDEVKRRVVKLETVNKCLVETTRRVVDSDITNIKARNEVKLLVESVTKGKIVNVNIV